jgi:hypothetical protein
VGSVNRASRRAALTLLEHFQANQELFLDKMVDGGVEQRRIYAGLITHVLPKQVDVGPADTSPISMEELTKALIRVTMALDGEIDRRQALADIGLILTGDGGRLSKAPAPLIRSNNGETSPPARSAPLPKSALASPAARVPSPLIRSNNGGSPPGGRAALANGAAISRLPGLGGDLRAPADHATVNAVG